MIEMQSVNILLKDWHWLLYHEAINNSNMSHLLEENKVPDVIICIQEPFSC